MIPTNITSPTGCGKEYMHIYCGKQYRTSGYNMIEDFTGKVFLCPSCESSRKAVIKALIDEKKEEIKTLKAVMIAESGNDLDCWCGACQCCRNHIKELTQEINTLEGLE